MKKNEKSFLNWTWIWYRIYRRILFRYRSLTVYFISVRYRFVKRVTNRFRQLSVWAVTVRYRLLRRWRFRIFRIIIFFVWRLWVGKVYGFERLVKKEPAIIVSNHLSYFDFWILSAILLQ